MFDQLVSQQADAFVARVDAFVTAIEQHLSRLTAILNAVQFVMVALTIGSAIALLYSAYLFIFNPLSRLQAGLVDAAICGGSAIAAAPAPETIFGSQLMTEQERTVHRARMWAAQSDEARNAIRAEHHEQMRARAQERGVTLPEAPPARGARTARASAPNPRVPDRQARGARAAQAQKKPKSRARIGGRSLESCKNDEKRHSHINFPLVIC